MVRLTDRPDMTLDVYRGRKTTMQQQQLSSMGCWSDNPMKQYFIGLTAFSLYTVAPPVNCKLTLSNI